MANQWCVSVSSGKLLQTSDKQGIFGSLFLKRQQKRILNGSMKYLEQRVLTSFTTIPKIASSRFRYKAHTLLLSQGRILVCGSKGLKETSVEAPGLPMPINKYNQEHTYFYLGKVQKKKINSACESKG